MISQENHQYAKLECKKPSKVKTTTLKFEDQVQRQDPYKRSLMPQANSNKNGSTSTFNYLGDINNINSTKSYEDLIKQSQKILEMQQQLSSIPKKQPAIKRVRSRTKRMQKKQKMDRKGSNQYFRKDDNLLELQETDIQKFENQSLQKRDVIQKIKFVRSLCQKCEIISPLLLQIELNGQQNSNVKKSNFSKQPRKYLSKQNELEKLELQLKLMRQNLFLKNPKQILSLFEMQSLCRLEIQMKKQKGQGQDVSKYFDSVNLQKNAETLQNQLEQMQQILFGDVGKVQDLQVSQDDKDENCQQIDHKERTQDQGQNDVGTDE